MKTLFPARDYITGHRFEIARCGDCGLTITVPRPVNVSPYYPTGYYGRPAEQRFPGVIERLHEWLNARRVRWVGSMAAPVQGRVLDVGCGRGQLLKGFRRLGWEVQGTEVSEEAAAHARDVQGLKVVIGELAALVFPARHFDVVTLWHVLEHVADPRAMLREVNRVLKPGGLLLIGVPNFGGWEARWCRDKWFHLDVPRHMTHFTRSSLAETLQQAGFRAHTWSGFALEYDIFSLVQSLLSRAGLRHNLLYHALRLGPAKLTAKERVARWQVWLALACALPLGLVAVPATWWAGILCRGGTLTVLAVKQDESAVDTPP